MVKTTANTPFDGHRVLSRNPITTLSTFWRIGAKKSTYEWTWVAYIAKTAASPRNC